MRTGFERSEGMLNEEEVKEEIRGLEDLEMETEMWGVGKLGDFEVI